MPRSSAACTARSGLLAALLANRCSAQLIGMQPRPIAPTSSAAAPIVLRSTWSVPLLRSLAGTPN